MMTYGLPERLGPAAACIAALAALATQGVAAPAGDGGSQLEFVYCATESSSGYNLYQYRIAEDGTLQPLAPPTIALKGEARPPFAAPGHRAFYVPLKGAILQYRIHANGTLKPLSPPSVPTGSVSGQAFVRTGRFLYTGDDESESIHQYAVSASGALSPLAPPRVRTGHGAGNLGPILSPDGRTLYSLNGDCTIGQFRVGSDGRLSPLSPAAVPAAPPQKIPAPPSMVLGARGHYAYASADIWDQATHSPKSLLTVFRVGKDGTLQQMSSLLTPPGSVVRRRAATLYVGWTGTGLIHAYDIGPRGRPIPGPRIHGPANGSPFAFTPSGQYAYQVGETAWVLRYRRQPDGSLMVLPHGPPVPGRGQPFAAYIDPSGRFLYVGTHSNWGGSAIGQFRIHKDGSLTPLSPRSVRMPFSYNLTIVRLPAPKAKAGGKHKPAAKTKGKAPDRKGANKR